MNDVQAITAVQMKVNSRAGKWLARNTRGGVLVEQTVRGARNLWVVNGATGAIRTEAEVLADEPDTVKPAKTPDPLIAQVAALTEAARGDGRKVSPEEAMALLRVLRGPAHCRRCDYFGLYGEHTEGGFPDAAQCASLASYGND